MPVTLRANSIGSLAAEALRTPSNSEVIGQVVNAFSNSFYVKTTGGELIFVTNRSLRSPITINLDSTSSFDQIVRPLDLVRSSGKEIHVSDVSIDLCDVPSYQCKSDLSNRLDLTFDKTWKALKMVSFILSIIDTSQSVLDRHGLTHDGVTRFVRDGVLRLRREGMEERFRKAALGIVGLGSGFTPSGDDTLGGFLAAYNAVAKTVKRSQILLDFSTLQEKTSWVSARLLDYMQRLILDEQLFSMIEVATRGDVDTLVLTMESLLPRGHTSGIDIATGASLALSLTLDIAFDMEETETIISTLGLAL